MSSWLFFLRSVEVFAFDKLLNMSKQAKQLHRAKEYEHHSAFVFN